MCTWNFFVMELCGLCVTGVVACGGEADRPVDAAPTPDASPPPCAYTEKTDAANDPAAEPTGLTVGSKPLTLCGTINTGHFHTDTNTVDVDAYRVTSDGTSNLVVRFSGSSGSAASAANVDFSVFVFNTDEHPTLLSGGHNNAIVHDHGAFLISLPAGTYDVVVTASNSADLTAPFDYKVQIAPDGPTRCPAVSAPAAYAEAADGTGGNNDVVALDFDFDPAAQLTAASADAPEATGLTIDGLTPIRITGTSANEDAEDDYMDRDTYLIQTGAATSELTLRLDWADPQNNLDYFVFPAGQTQALGAGTHFEGHEEYDVVPVEPDTKYWIWVGSHDGSTGLPATYDLTICGAASTP